MFSINTNKPGDTNESSWAGVDPLDRLRLDRSYAEQLAQSSKVCGVCRDLDLERYPFALIRTANGVA